MTDAAAEPVAYWTGLAYEAVIAFIRARQAELGFTQPQFWLLRNLSPHDISPDGHPMTIGELTEAMRSYLRREDDLAAEAETLLDRGWLTLDDTGRLSITPAGEQARLDLRKHTPAIRAQIHAGITETDYATTVRVLQHMIRNVSPTPA